jgi:hypothetical protein
MRSMRARRVCVTAEESNAASADTYAQCPPSTLHLIEQRLSVSTIAAFSEARWLRGSTARSFGDGAHSASKRLITRANSGLAVDRLHVDS